MARNGFPSMTALLGLLAIAGYQNRDKIADMLSGLGKNNEPGHAPDGQPRGLDGLLGGLGGLLGGAGAGGILNNGLGELLDRFKQNGHGEEAESWVRTGPNQEIAPPKLKEAIGSEVLDALAQHTGLSKDEILARLSRELPSAVDKYTPQGRLPA